MTSGAVLIVACLLTLITYRRLRAAVMFFVPAMLFASPWFGWYMAHGGMPAAKLELSEWSLLLWKNAMWLAAAPFTAMSGYANLYPGLLTAVALMIVLIRRRQFVPDLFFGLYCIALLCRTEPPTYAFAPVLPLFLWMLWRAVRGGRFRLISQIAAYGLIAPALWFGRGSGSAAHRLAGHAEDVRSHPRQHSAQCDPDGRPRPGLLPQHQPHHVSRFHANGLSHLVRAAASAGHAG